MALRTLRTRRRWSGPPAPLEEPAGWGEVVMTPLEAEALVALWEDLLARSDLPPRVAGVTSAEYELARMMAPESIPVVAEPPERVWVWSDLHLGDRTALEAFGRPFPSVPVMTARLLAARRRTVPEGDLVICLGDVVHAAAVDSPHLAVDLQACPGRRLLVLGNRDLGLRTWLAGAGFEAQCVAALCATDPPLALSHVPRVDVSVETVAYAPVRLDRILHSARAALAAASGNQRAR